MIKKVLFSLIFISIAGLVWYLFIRSYDIKIKFKAKTLAPIVTQSLKVWAAHQPGEILSFDFHNHILQQKIKVEKNNYYVKWKISFTKDSLSIVHAEIRQSGAKFYNRIFSPFINTLIEKEGLVTVRNFYEYLKILIDKTHVDVMDKVIFKEKYCLCVPIETTQSGKAEGMMKNYNFLTDFIVHNNLKTDGEPMVKVKEWNEKSNILTYDFCFPIKNLNLTINHTKIKTKWVERTEAIKAIYYGNYITSDIAWYVLTHYAWKNNIEISLKPIEVFYNNPNVESNEKEWKAEIFIPITKN